MDFYTKAGVVTLGDAKRSHFSSEIAPALAVYDDAIKNSIGLRLQRRLPAEQVKEIAKCRSVHRDYSLQF